MKFYPLFGSWGVHCPGLLFYFLPSPHESYPIVWIMFQSSHHPLTSRIRYLMYFLELPCQRSRRKHLVMLRLFATQTLCQFIALPLQDVTWLYVKVYLINQAIPPSIFRALHLFHLLQPLTVTSNHLVDRRYPIL